MLRSALPEYDCFFLFSPEVSTQGVKGPPYKAANPCVFSRLPALGSQPETSLVCVFS